MIGTIIVTAFSLLTMVGGIIIQIILSKRMNKWLGLVLPFITFSYSLLTIFSLVITEGMTGWDIFVLFLSTFFISNIPTLLLLTIYFACREKIKHKQELEKMNVQDL